MRNWILFFAPAFLLAIVPCAPLSAQEGGFFEELFDPIDHTHFSDLGTPYVHPFTIEPPQIHQDVFFIYKYTKNDLEGANEHEAEFHVDWALTKRIGFVFAAPLIGVEGPAGMDSAGIGDLEFAPRFMLIKRDKFILAANIFMTFPTGDATRDLGSGETVISPFLTSWHDLGNWCSLLLNFGPQIGTETGDTSMTFALSLTHSWLGVPFFGDTDHEGHDEHATKHFPAGMTTVYIELNSETELQDQEQTFIEIMPGISYVIDPHAEVRFGVLLPVSQIQRYDAQYFTSFTWIY